MSRSYISSGLKHNEEMVNSIKQKYAKVGSISPNKRKWLREGNGRDNVVLVAAAEGEKDLGSRDYQSLRLKYEDSKQLTARAEVKREEFVPQVQTEWRGVQTHTCSSPIKILQENNTMKLNNFLSVRRSEISQYHLQRASTQKAQRKMTQQTLQSIDNLLKSIRKTLTPSPLHP